MKKIIGITGSGKTQKLINEITKNSIIITNDVELVKSYLKAMDKEKLVKIMQPYELLKVSLSETEGLKDLDVFIDDIEAVINVIFNSTCKAITVNVDKETTLLKTELPKQLNYNDIYSNDLTGELTYNFVFNFLTDFLYKKEFFSKFENIDIISRKLILCLEFLANNIEGIQDKYPDFTTPEALKKYYGILPFSKTLFDSFKHEDIEKLKGDKNYLLEEISKLKNTLKNIQLENNLEKQKNFLQFQVLELGKQSSFLHEISQLNLSRATLFSNLEAKTNDIISLLEENKKKGEQIDFLCSKIEKIKELYPDLDIDIL